MLIGILVSVGISLLVTGVNIAVTEHYADKAKTENKEQMAQQERRAKVMQLKEFNQALAAYNKGTLTAKMELLKEERKAANHGTPVTTA